MPDDGGASGDIRLQGIKETATIGGRAHKRHLGYASVDCGRLREMIGRAPRRVPLISGLLCLAGAISALIFWTAPSSDPLYWLRGAIFGLLAWIGIWDLKVAAFASDDQIQRATSGDVEVWKEHGVAAPSAFKLKDVLFTIYALGILLIFVIVVDWV